MIAPAAVTPRFAVLIAGAVMTYSVCWGFIRVVGTGFPLAALASLALLCAAFLIACGRGTSTRTRAVLAGLLALSGIGTTQLGNEGTVAAADVWLTPAVACVALLLVWRQQHLIAWATIGGQIALLWAFGGFAQLQDLGVLTTVLTLVVVGAAGRVLGWYAAQMQQYSHAERETLEWRVAQDAYQQAHQQRIEQTGRLAGSMLQQIVSEKGRLDREARAECRLLHQAIRDETRGRLLLNDAVREQVQAHRRRGATVQLLDDGELGRLETTALARVHDEIATIIAPLISDRIVVRAGIRDGIHSVTIAAVTIDPIASALGEYDEQVDLWHAIKIRAESVRQ